MVGAVVFMVNNKILLYIVDYYSKFLVVKKVKNMLDKDLIWATKVVFDNLACLKIVSDVGINCFRMV